MYLHKPEEYKKKVGDQHNSRKTTTIDNVQRDLRHTLSNLLRTQIIGLGLVKYYLLLLLLVFTVTIRYAIHRKDRMTIFTQLPNTVYNNQINLQSAVTEYVSRITPAS